MTAPRGTQAPPPTPFAGVPAAAPATPPQATPWARSEGDDLPPEIARVAEGGVTVFKGGLMNPGQQTWYALDLQRRSFVAVLRRTGQGAGAPQATGPVRRPEGAAPGTVESVHQAPASAAQCKAFAALAHRLLASPAAADDAEPAPIPQGPLRRTLVLLHQGRALHMPQGPAAGALQAGIVQLIQQPLQALLRGGD